MTPLVDRFRSLPPELRASIFAEIEKVPGTLADLRYDFEPFWAREDQIVSVSEIERYGLIVFSGPRGCGKTEAAVNLFCREVFSGRVERPRIFAANEGDIDKAVVHGESGIMQALPKHMRPRWIAGEGPAGVLRFPNGIEAVCFSAAAPEGAVSHQSDLDFYDDVAKWGARGSEAWSHARASCRKGYMGGIVATTRRGATLLRKLLKGDVDGVMIRRPTNPRGNKYNLAAKYYRQMEAEFDGTDFFAQEMDDQDLGGESPFASVEFAKLRAEPPEDLKAIAVWIDPATSSATHSCEVGVVVVGIDKSDVVYGLDDGSKVMNEREWPEAAWNLFEKWQDLRPRAKIHMGIETNIGGNMGPGLLRGEEKIRRLREKKPGVSVVEIRTVTAKESKVERATYPARLVVSGQLRMCKTMAQVEKQLRELDNSESKKRDRADAFVHGVIDLGELKTKKADNVKAVKGILERNEGFGGGRWSGEDVGFDFESGGRGGTI